MKADAAPHGCRLYYQAKRRASRGALIGRLCAWRRSLRGRSKAVVQGVVTVAIRRPRKALKTGASELKSCSELAACKALGIEPNAAKAGVYQAPLATQAATRPNSYDPHPARGVVQPHTDSPG